jgi:formylglycine-generating enzyme required for sulfatase activity
MQNILSTISIIALLISASAQAEPKKIFRDCPQCPEMVTIPAGKFLMGTKRLSSREGMSEEQLKYAGEFEEYPQHEVTIKSFSMGIKEVTQREWVFIMGNNPSENKGDDLPVENITWEEAKAFAHKLSEKTGKHYRLPTEAEWEYAARAGTQSVFYFGDNMQLAGAPIRQHFNWSKKRIDFVVSSIWGRAEILPIGFYTSDGRRIFELRGASGGVAAADIFYMVVGFQTFVLNPAATAYIDALAVPSGY